MKKSVIPLLILLFILTLFGTRFVGLNWGLPYPMHPDERNIAIALMQLTCHKLDASCLNPHFFAYGQFTIYISFILIKLYHIFTLRGFGLQINPQEAFLALRVLSAAASTATAFVLFLSLNHLQQSHKVFVHNFLLALFFVFSPVMIQMAHFGTTESIVILFTSLLVYYSLVLFRGRISFRRYSFISGLILGLAVGTKVSSLLLGSIPFIVYLMEFKKHSRRFPALFVHGIFFCVTTAFFVVFSSPQSFISFHDFVGAMRYESDVAFGTYRAFYTNQFTSTIPLVFQALTVFPYSLGFIVFILSILGFIILSWKRKEYIFLRLVFFAFFIPSASMYAKWTRFLAPVYPIMLLVAAQTLHQFYVYMSAHHHALARWVLGGLIFFAILPGVAYLGVYTRPDVRFQASEWVFAHMPEHAHVLYETANVVDIPILPPNSNAETKKFIGTSFDFYHLDENMSLAEDLQRSIEEADYIIVPSRRVFYNYTCIRPTNDQLPTNNNQLSVVNRKLSIANELLEGKYPNHCQELNDRYPLLSTYFTDLFSGTLGFKQVAEFTSYPRISLFGKTIVEFPDEQAEETWTVFDHPVIRIYERIKD
ncbi:DUF2723 domain-containing protein [Candidatus Woesebacteria bacterium]|nr:DUF2723 domain-containing protein [Candidatus Woesebacteria bacterium]